MPQLFLLGDSVIDNAAYLDPGEPDVAAQCSAQLGPHWYVERLAIDGSVTAQVIETVASVPAGAHVFVSTGGNDALQHKPRLASFMPRRFASVLVELRDIREAFRSDYVALMDALAKCPVMVATIYNPRYTGVERVVQGPAEGGLSLFNDVIQQEALARGYAVLDLRRLFSDAGDYANPIEPSAQGGAKIAAKVAAWARGA